MGTIVLTLPYPISANRYWASRVIKSRETGKWMSMTYVTPEAKSYKAEVAWLAKAAGVRAPLAGRVALDIKLYPHRPQDWERRMRKDPLTWDDTVQCIDLGNAEKVLADALEGVAFDNDKQIWRQTKERMEPDGEARVIVTITPIAAQALQSDLIGAAA